MRSGNRLHARLFPHDHQRPRRSAGIRARHRRLTRRKGSTRARAGVPALTPSLQAAIDRRSHRAGPQRRPVWTQFSYPAGWRYDILRGLDYLRNAGVAPDPRMAEAIEIVASKRDMDGRWALGIMHPDEVIAEPGITEGSPSRWNTLRALRVLNWYSARD